MANRATHPGPLRTPRVLGSAAVLAVAVVGALAASTLAPTRACAADSAARAGAAPTSVAAPTGAVVPADDLAAGPDYRQVRRQLARYIRALMAENHTAGLAIALVDGQQVVWRKGFGYADVAAGRKVTPRTISTSARWPRRSPRRP